MLNGPKLARKSFATLVDETRELHVEPSSMLLYSDLGISRMRDSSRNLHVPT